MAEKAHHPFARYLEDFRILPRLRQRILTVLQALPTEVQQDFLRDVRFTVSIDNYQPGKGSTVFMAVPGTSGDVSRNVVLRPRLDGGSDSFAHYVIAHEFAHAYLRNGPWGEITDVEEAADALAACWGFPRTSSGWSRWWFGLET